MDFSHFYTVKFFLTICIILSSAWFAYSQESSKEQKPRIITVEFKDGTKLQGEFLRLTSDSLYFNHNVLGKQVVAQDQLKTFEFVDNMDPESEEEEEFPEVSTEGFYKKYGFGKLNHNRYTITPNGFGPEKGETYLRSVYFFINTFEFGISDHFSFQFGTAALYLPLGSIKYHTEVGNNTSIGVTGGAMVLPAGTFTESTNDFLEAVGFGSVGITKGDKELSGSIGAGVVLANGFAVPAFFVGGFAQFNRSAGMAFEMPIIGAGITGNNTDFLMPSLMAKVFSKRSMWGLGVTYPLSYDRPDEEWTYGAFIPTLTYSFRFGPLTD